MMRSRCFNKHWRCGRTYLDPCIRTRVRSLEDLAGIYISQGNYDDAELLFKQALSVQEDALGSMHPDTATALNNLAYFYEHRGKYDDAELLFSRALSIVGEVLGPAHPDTLAAVANLKDLRAKRGGV